MDLRVSKTEKSIRNAFIELRSKKSLEKVTVKELCERACINKATFYRHYTDIYALSETIENELIDSCMEMIAEPDQLLEKEGILSLMHAMDSQKSLFYIVFSGTQSRVGIHKIHKFLMEKILTQHPEYQNDMEKKIILTTLIYGIFQAFLIYKDMGVERDTMVNTIVKLNQSLKTERINQ